MEKHPESPALLILMAIAIGKLQKTVVRMPYCDQWPFPHIPCQEIALQHCFGLSKEAPGPADAVTVPKVKTTLLRMRLKAYLGTLRMGSSGLLDWRAAFCGRCCCMRSKCRCAIEARPGVLTRCGCWSPRTLPIDGCRWGLSRLSVI